MTTGSKAYLETLMAIVGEDNVAVHQTQIKNSLRDNSWLSPLLTEHITQLRSDEGGTMGVDAVVSPGNVDELRQVVAVAVRHKVPIIPRGGGTTNFGQTIPLQGGLILDVRRLTGVHEITDDSITVAAGTFQGDVEEAAQAQGKELTVLTTTYASATAAGWVAGGHVGLGANSFGTIWDGNVLRAKIITAEDPPRELTLSGNDLLPVLHTYGTTGIITEVTFPLVEAHEWLEAVPVFDSFEDAVHFTDAMNEETSIVQRVVTAQEASIAPGFTPLQELYEDGQSPVLMIVDSARESRCRQLCQQHNGRWRVWLQPGDPQKISLGLMVYGHRMLWLKKLAPDAAFLHVYFSPENYLEQLLAIKDRFGDDVWEEFKYIRSGWLRSLRGLPAEGSLPAAVLTLVPGGRDFLDEVMAFCDAIGVSYLNPHTFLLEESGLFKDFHQIAKFKKDVDPNGLLNPGKIGQQILENAENEKEV